jgi:cytochrome c-type biogenesis protein CcmH/NrfG
LLLDRKRINKWAKWVALGLAVVFALSFLLLGVGYGGGAGFNLFDLFGKKDSTNTTLNVDQRVAALQATLAQNPKDVTTLLALATAYQQNEDLKTAATYLEQVIAVDPSQKDVYPRLANIYLNQDVADYTAAATVLNKAISVDPNNADLYLKLGIAQNSLGNTGGALLAWQKYLTLAPNGDMASVIKEQVATLSKAATTTTSPASTTTTAAGGSISTTAASTSSTVGSTTTTAASTTTSAP